jgi:hypothetical protein
MQDPGRVGHWSCVASNNGNELKNAKDQNYSRPFARASYKFASPIFMEAIPLCYLQTKLQLLCRTQQSFTLIASYMYATCFGIYIDLP